MRADDPRHGTNAGYQTHWREGEDACQACREGRERYRKRRRVAVENGAQPYFTLGQRYWRITMIYRAPDLVAAGAVSHDTAVYKLRAGGPNAQVRASTLERLATADTTQLYTPIGLTRRLQALAVIGWTIPEIVAATGLARAGISRYRNQVSKYSWAGVPERIVKVYNDLHMQPKTDPNKWERAAINGAKARGWVAPMAWDNIDDPDEKPATAGRIKRRNPDDYDPAVVERILAGDFSVPSTAAERAVIVETWVRRGRSVNELERATGWQPSRYHKTGEAA